MNSNFKTPALAVQKFFRSFIFTALLANILTGCGGGDASVTSTENELPSPVSGGISGGVLLPSPVGQSPVPPSSLNVLPRVSVGPRQFADPNVLLNLRGTAVAAAGSQIVKTLWTQVTGPQVIIPSPELLDNIVLVPDVSVATHLEFRLTAQDSEGRIDSATIAILIKPVPTFVKVIGGVFNEADESATFKIRLNAPSTVPVTVSYVTQDGTAGSVVSEARDELVDYVAASGEIVFAAGEVLKEVPVTLINDTLQESDESFSLQVTAIDGTSAHANTGVLIIRNGVEPQVSQELQFSETGPIVISPGEEYNNLLNPGPGTGDVIYSSSNSSVASVNAQGVAAAISVGTTTITATKFADDTYLAATASYTLQVVSRGTAPTVSIQQKDGYSVQLGETVDLTGSASDQEDGTIPTVGEGVVSSEGVVSGTPLTALSWSSSIDGFLGYGTSLDINTLSQGTHWIKYSVTDSHGNTGSASIRVLVGNIAPFAGTNASSTYCANANDPEHCYFSYRVNDTNLSNDLGGLYSWVNLDTVALPQWVDLNWEGAATINSVDVYTTAGYILRNYDIEYFDGESWIVVASITDNTEKHRTHPISTITTYRLRVMARRGSILQPQHARINEIVVFGTTGVLAAGNL